MKFAAFQPDMISLSLSHSPPSLQPRCQGGRRPTARHFAGRNVTGCTRLCDDIIHEITFKYVFGHSPPIREHATSLHVLKLLIFVEIGRMPAQVGAVRRVDDVPLVQKMQHKENFCI